MAKDPESATSLPNLPGYRFVAPLGRGSMGAVYQAVQLSMDRQVAIKLLPRHLAAERRFAERFLEEARTVARLAHPNIVTGIDVGSHEGTYYFVMELMTGESVGAALRRGQTFSEREAIAIAAQVAGALEHARGAGIVHRDVKPDNILRNPDGVAKLGDLGLALELGTGEPTRLAGTPQYIAPEAVRRETIDTRADIYSLGATLFHMLTGAPPFSGTAREVIEAHTTQGIPDPRTVNPGISARAAMLVAAMTAQDPAQRYQTPGEAAEAMRVYLEEPSRSLPLPAGIKSGSRRAPARDEAQGATVSGRGHAWRPVAMALGALAVGAVAVAMVVGGGDPEPVDPVVSRPDVAPVATTPDPTPEPVTQPAQDPERLAAEAREVEAARAFERVRIRATENPEDHVQIRKDLATIATAYAGTTYATQALALADELAARRETAASAKLEALVAACDARLAEGDLAGAHAALAGFPADLADTQASVELARRRTEVEAMARRDLGIGLTTIETALAASPPDVATAETKHASLMAFAALVPDGAARLAAARKAIDERQAAAAEAAAKARSARVEAALADVAQTEKRAAAFLDLLDIAGARQAWVECAARLEPLAELPGQAAQVNAALASLSGLLGVETRVLAGLRKLVGTKIDLADGTKAPLSFEGDRPWVTGGDGARMLALADVAPAALAPLATAGASTALEHVATAEYLLIAGAVVEAEAELQLAIKGQAPAELVTPLAARIATAKMAALDGLAAALWEESKGLLERSKWKQAEKKIKELLETYGETPFVTEHRAEIEEALALAAADGKAPHWLSRVLHGKLEVVKDQAPAPLVIEIAYDFEKPDQLEDFAPVTFRMPGGGGGGGGGNGAPQAPPSGIEDWKIADGVLSGSGQMELRWKPIVVGDLQLEYEMTSPRHSNLGMRIYAEGDTGYLYCLGFDLLPDPRIATVLGSSRNLFMKLDPDELASFRGPPMAGMAQMILSQSSKPEIGPGRKAKVQLVVKGEAMVFAVNKKDPLDGKSESFRRGQLGWFAINNQMTMDELVIVARIDRGWLAQAEAALNAKPAR